MGLMLCAYCSGKYIYPDDFPALGYAKCKDCFAKEASRSSLWKRLVHFLRRLMTART